MNSISPFHEDHHVDIYLVPLFEIYLHAASTCLILCIGVSALDKSATNPRFHRLTSCRERPPPVSLSRDFRGLSNLLACPIHFLWLVFLFIYLFIFCNPQASSIPKQVRWKLVPQTALRKLGSLNTASNFFPPQREVGSEAFHPLILY